MKKSVTILVVALTLLLASGTIAYGAENSGNNIIVPFYEETAIFTASFNISTQGVAEIKGNLGLLESSTADKVRASVRITNISTGKVVYNKTINMSYSTIQKKYVLNEQYQLSTKGRYRMDLTYKCYDGTKLLESITANAITRTYA